MTQRDRSRSAHSQGEVRDARARGWARLGRQAYRTAREQQRAQPQILGQPLSQFVFESTGVYNYQWYPDLQHAPYGCPNWWQIMYRATIDLDNNTVFEKQVDCRGVASVNGWHFWSASSRETR